MREKIKTIIEVLLLIAVIFWVVDKISFSSDIKQDVTALVYVDGEVTGETTISIDGEITHYLFHDNEWFNGALEIPAYEKSQRDGFIANISWNEEDNIQKIRYTGHGTIYSDVVSTNLIISRDMDAFVIWLQDGSIIATSQDAYDLYTSYIEMNETGGMSIRDVYGVPEIE